jgi:hypothetical protein
MPDRKDIPVTPEWFRPARYHTIVLIFAMAICSVGFAWLTYGLVSIAMKNVNFLTMYGLMAAMEGGAVQLLEICLKGMIALLFYLGFKGIEHELTYRWLGRHH